MQLEEMVGLVPPHQEPTEQQTKEMGVREMALLMGEETEEMEDLE